VLASLGLSLSQVVELKLVWVRVVNRIMGVLYSSTGSWVSSVLCVTNEDIGAVPDLADHSTLMYPFIFQEGIAEQSYMIQLVGAAEKAKILADEEQLLSDLCAYRKVLCLPHVEH
jgi:hypothetical protein